MARRPLVVIAAVASAALLVAVGLVLLKSGHHRTGTSGAARAFPIRIGPDSELCQAGESLAKGTGRVRFVPDPRGGPIGPLQVTVRSAAGRRVASARIPPHDYAKTEAARAIFPGLRAPADGGTVCVRNGGRAAMAILGEPVPSPVGAAALRSGALPPSPPWFRIRFDYDMAHASSWWSFAPTVADRFPLFKATFLGAWAFWVVMAALLALALGTIWYAARALAR
jgi:hypothetical protein